MKLDLHTHCFEATGTAYPDARVVERILVSIKEAGLDGIAITEHDNSDYGYRVKDIVDEFFPGETVVIPGREVRRGLNHMVELYLPDDLVFRFIAHPVGQLNCYHDEFKDIHGVEIENGNQFINEDMAREFAWQRELLLLSNSDAHSLADIGRHHTEVDIDELCRRVRLMREAY